MELTAQQENCQHVVSLLNQRCSATCRECFWMNACAGMQGCDVVIHAAAKIDDWGPYSAFHEITVEGTRNTLAAARAAGVAKFVFISSEAVCVKVRLLRVCLRKVRSTKDGQSVCKRGQPLH